MYDPAHCCYGGDWSGDKFDHEEVAKTVRWDEEEWELDDPEEEVCYAQSVIRVFTSREELGLTRYHPLSRNPLAQWDMIFNAVITWPNRSQHDGYTLSTIGALNTEPEHSENRSRNNAEVTKIVTE